MQFTSFVVAALSVGSAFAAPAPATRDIQIVDTALSAVSSIKALVEAELSSIESVVQNAVGQDVVPILEKTLGNVGQEVSSLLTVVLPLVTKDVLPLAENEIANVPALLNEVLSIVDGILGMAEDLVEKLVPDVLAIVKPELSFVLNTVIPVVKPVLKFATSAVGDVVTPVAKEVTGLVGQVDSVASGILKPIGGVVVAIL
ncbi:Uu.00g069470.m01.CDS01 [Anthostomella pinea]|uniref:Uu.00g069470.m01.CDS01 n=1 Tax=Anthostomella pinea TaxID=933095 RepID=A0AAI8VUH9_9PEZI|nr:Uu.00g069470.m01.CDS01 [Anthostomella pinea]